MKYKKEILILGVLSLIVGILWYGRMKQVEADRKMVADSNYWVSKKEAEELKQEILNDKEAKREISGTDNASFKKVAEIE